MFERFTDRARRVVVVAQEEARLLGHNYIGTEHILLGLLREGEGVAARVLGQLGISAEAVKKKVEAIIGEGGSAPSGHIPFTPRSKKVLELALREAMALGHNYIGTEHILLGLVREGEGVGAQVLVTLGAELSQVRTAVVAQLSRLGPGVRMQPADMPRATPAAAKVGIQARRLAGGSAVGSQHYLLALLDEEDSLAAKALAELGVTRRQLEEKLAQLEPAGTSDETPEEAGARRIRMRVEGKLLTLEIDDPNLAAAFEKAIVGRKARILSGTDPEAVGFPALWSAVSRAVDDMTRRLVRPPGTRRPAPTITSTVAGPVEYWQPAGWDLSGHAAGYWIVSRPGGVHEGYLQMGEGVDRAAARAWLRDWLRANRDTLGRPGGRHDETGCATLSVVLDGSGDAYSVRHVTFGPDGPPGAEPIPLTALVDAALDDLSAQI